MFKHKSLVMVVMVVGLLLLFTAGAFAQTGGLTIGGILQGQVGQILTLNGTVHQLLEGNDFMMKLADNTLLRVDPGPPWYHTIQLNVNDLVEVTGKLGYQGPPWAGSNELELDACHIVRGVGETSETIEIRDCTFLQPPPWAGRPPHAGPPGGGRGGNGGGGRPPWAGPPGWRP